MMNTLRNRVQLIGNLGTTPEIKNLEGGKKMAKLLIATSETYKNQKGEILDDGSYWLDVPYFDDRELINDILRHGSQVEVLGPEELKTRLKQEAQLILAKLQ